MLVSNPSMLLWTYAVHIGTELKVSMTFGLLAAACRVKYRVTHLLAD